MNYEFNFVGGKFTMCNLVLGFYLDDKLFSVVG
jgi:hypothetical protein